MARQPNPAGPASNRKAAGPAPTRANLHEAALRHLARFAATEAGLLRVLQRRVRRWAQAAEAEGVEPDDRQSQAAAREVAQALAASGAVDDAAFAAARAARLARAGRSRRATAAHLAAKGVGAELLAAALPSDDFQAAVAFARRRRLGPFRQAAADETVRGRELAAMGRAGFSRDVAERALALDRDAAEAAVAALRRG